MPQGLDEGEAEENYLTLYRLSRVNLQLGPWSGSKGGWYTTSAGLPSKRFSPNIGLDWTGLTSIHGAW
jgi:hypothetical protein